MKSQDNDGVASKTTKEKVKSLALKAKVTREQTSDDSDSPGRKPALLEPNGFCFWKACFETYVKSKDIDSWQVIQNGDFYYEVEDSETKLINEMSYELLKDD
ncbi:hypothetical protein Tco_1448147 [Tanacetum coccineum]